MFEAQPFIYRYQRGIKREDGVARLESCLSEVESIGIVLIAMTGYEYIIVECKSPTIRRFNGLILKMKQWMFFIFNQRSDLQPFRILLRQIAILGCQTKLTCSNE